MGQGVEQGELEGSPLSSASLLPPSWASSSFSPPRLPLLSWPASLLWSPRDANHPEGHCVLLLSL